MHSISIEVEGNLKGLSVPSARREWLPARSVTANIGWYVVSEKRHHFWELR